MPSPFDALAARTLQSVFARFGVAATHRTPALVDTACDVVVNGADDVETIGNVALVAGQRLVEVRVSQVAAPLKGDSFIVDALEFKIVAAPRRDDPSRLVWTCLCDEIAP